MKKKIKEKYDFLIPYFEGKMPVAEPELQYTNSYEYTLVSKTDMILPCKKHKVWWRMEIQ